MKGYDRFAHPQVRARDPDSWARDTAVRRIPKDIFPRLMAENESHWPADQKDQIIADLQCLVSSLQAGSTGRLEDLQLDTCSPDIDTWNLEILPSERYEERNWMDAAWLTGEYYFYRRVAQAVRYYSTCYDPFAATKFDGICSALPAVERMSGIYMNHLDSRVGGSESAVGTARLDLTFGIYGSLWGNKKDLSLWPAGTQEASHDTPPAEGWPSLTEACSALAQVAEQRVLANDIEEVIDTLLQKGRSEDTPRRVGIVVDNAGYELCCDLLLGYILLQTGLVDHVDYYTKGYPTFVSDATTRDCMNTIHIMKGSGSTVSLNQGDRRHVSGLPIGPATRRLGQGLHDMLAEGRICFVQDVYWCLPAPFVVMPIAIKRVVRENIIIFMKGDANYRRLIDDRKCPYDTPSKSVFSYWKDDICVPMCALRSCKSEVCCGVSVQAQERAQEVHGDVWIVNGDWGLIQFVS